MAGPCGAGRPDRRRPRLHAVNGPGGSPVSHPHDVEDWACRLAERLPSGDVRHLALAAAEGEPGVRQLRATTASPILRDACEQLLRRLRHAEPAYLSGLLTGAAHAVERTRHHQSVSVVWTGPESGVSSSRLTGCSRDRIDQRGTVGDPSGELRDPDGTTDQHSVVGCRITGRSCHTAGRAPRGQPVVLISIHALPSPRRAPPALALVVPTARRGTPRKDHRGRRPSRARRQRKPHQPSHGVQPRMRHPPSWRPAAPCHPRPHHGPVRGRISAPIVSAQRTIIHFGVGRRSMGKVPKH